MKKTVIVLVSLLALLFGACSQIPGLTPTPGTSSSPAVNPDDLFKTAVAQTLTARPTLPPGVPSDTPGFVTPPSLNTETPTPIASPVLAVTDTAALFPSATLPATDTQTSTPVVAQSATGNVPTATSFPANVTPPTPVVTSQVTAIWTLAVRTYGTLPPAVPSSQVTLINKANTEAYISLQVTMPDGTYSILEYPVEGRVKIDAPVGSYLYVAWVGGRKMVGEFRLSNNDDLSIVLYRDRVVIK